MGASNLIRLGILAPPLAGLLSLVGLLSRYGTPNPRIDPEAAARTAASAGYFVSQSQALSHLALVNCARRLSSNRRLSDAH